MQIINKEPVFFDIDETLVIWNGENYRPHKKHIQSLKQHSKRKHFVVVWSAGGYEWAARVVKELGLEDYVDVVMSKPKWIYDDMEPNKWTYRIYLEE